MKQFIGYLIQIFKRRPFLFIISFMTSFLVIAFTVFYYSVASGWIVEMPDDQKLRDIQNYTASEIYSSDGVLLGKYFIQDRTNVAYEHISPNMINALIATEDVRFYSHKGVDKIGMFRVFFKSILLGDERAGGGSTLSQQLAKNLFPRKQLWIFSLPVNKLKEAIIAQKLESIFSKEEILKLYLNTVSFGDNSFGVESASSRFFNISSSKLRIEQAAVLVGMLKATTSYNPRKNYDRAVVRRNIVLDQMAKYKFISSHSADSLKKLPIRLDYRQVSHSDGPAPYFREHLRMELQQWCANNKRPDGSSYNLYTDGLKIYTTIDSRMQKYAEQAMEEHMAQLQKIFYVHWGKKAPWTGNYKIVADAKRRSAYYQTLKEEELSNEEINKRFKKPVRMKVFTWNGEVEKQMSPLDSIKHYLWFLRAGFIALEPGSGHIKAWVGGINHKYFQYDQVNTNAKRQAGSTFKPIVYAAALENGINPCEYFANERMVFSNHDNWSPRNSNNIYGGLYSMSGALTHSVNTVSAQLIIKTGVNKVVDLSRRLGITGDLDAFPSLALGTADVSLIEMTAAYAVFAARGTYTKPQYLLKVQTNTRETIFTAQEPPKKKVLDTEVSDMMVAMLQNVVTEGTAARLRAMYKLDFPIAGKTGTTQSHADGWFIGFTPRLVAGAWVGGEDRRIHFRSIELGQGASMALPIWAKFMGKIAKDNILKKYVHASFPPLSESLQQKLNCSPFIPPKDSLNFLQRLFSPKAGTPDNKNKENKPQKPQKERSEKFKETFNKIRNMFKRKVR
jgi:penicillin-binding protein 1A